MAERMSDEELRRFLQEDLPEPNPELEGFDLLPEGEPAPRLVAGQSPEHLEERRLARVLGEGGVAQVFPRQLQTRRLVPPHEVVECLADPALGQTHQLIVRT